MVGSPLLWGLPEAQNKEVAHLSPFCHSTDSPAFFFQFPVSFQLPETLNFPLLNPSF